jgi:hypothetical protein
MRKRASLEVNGRDVVSWRRDRLVAAGFSLPAAARLAADPRSDVHELTDIVERGCSPELAERILAPLERKDVA